MPRQKPTGEEIQERELLAEEFRKFSKDNLFTEIKLAEILQVSRRTVQMIRGAKVTPHPGTLRKWKTLVQKYKNEGWKP